MSSTRKILYVFLASPSDLNDERKTVRDVVDEINEGVANRLGYHIDLTGWEDTIPGYGRPQQLINHDVDRCDLFFGMIWKRWGTPPDHESGFTSGFEEEFDRSLARREQTKIPEIFLFFKTVPDDLKEYPGEDIKKVLNFREKLIADKKVLFQEFPTARDLEVLARKYIIAYVFRVWQADESLEAHGVGTKRVESSPKKAASEKASAEASPFAAEGFAFLKSLVDATEQGTSIEDLTAAEVARLRLLANSIEKPGNDDMDLGVHDLNILYLAHTNGMPLGETEVDCLARLGFHHLSFENVPLWRWYSILPKPRKTVFVSAAAGANYNETLGAIRVLDVLSIDFATTPNTRKVTLDGWFSDDSSARVRSAALGYLSRMGTATDYVVAKTEYEKGEPETVLEALNCMLQILLRTGQQNSAQQLVLESQVESLDPDTLGAVLDGFQNLEQAALLKGLEHRDPRVRRQSLKSLVARDSIDRKIVEPLCQDTNASIRSEAVGALSKLGITLTEAEAKEILIRPQKSPLFGGLLGGKSISDSEGEELFARYRSDTLRQLPEAALTKQVDTNRGHDHDAYFTRAEKFFAKHGDELRRDVDDTFSTYFQERVQRMKNILADHTFGQNLIQPTKHEEDLLRKKLTRRGLDILCSKGNREDVERIRENLRTGYAGTSNVDAEYLGKQGEWSDILLLADSEGMNLRGGSLLGGYVAPGDEVAKAILDISHKHSLSSLFALKLPTTVRKRVLELCSESRFSKIPGDVLLALFEDESEDVRKAAAIKAIQTFSAKQIKAILEDYIKKPREPRYCYYNVIHWLDLGASMPHEDTLRIVSAIGRSPR